MQIHCTNCNQCLEIEEQHAGMLFDCPNCGTELQAPEIEIINYSKTEVLEPNPPQVQNPAQQIQNNIQNINDNTQMSNEMQKQNSNGVVVAALVCMVIAAIVQYFSVNFLFFIYIPLYLVTFILGIVACCKSKVGQGVLYIIGSLILPLLVIAIQLFTLGAVSSVVAKSREINSSEFEITSDNETTSSSPTKSSNKTSSNLKTVQTTTQKVKKQKTNPIKGAFGYTLGFTFDKKSAIKVGELTSGDPIYAVQPTKKFRKFNEYSVLITPKTNKIYAIWARAKFDNIAAALEELKVVKALIEKKYGKKFENSTFSMNNQTSLYFGDRDIFIQTDNNYKSAMLEIRYTDDRITKIAEKEKISNEMKNSDSDAI